MRIKSIILVTLWWIAGLSTETVAAGAENARGDSFSPVTSSAVDVSPGFLISSSSLDTEAFGRAWQSNNSGLKAGWDMASLWLGYRQSGEFDANRYRVEPGFEVGVAGMDRYQRLTLTGFTAPGYFWDPSIEGLRNVRIYGWSLSMSRPVRLDRHWTFSWGAGYTSGLLIWDYTEPPAEADENITTDSLGFHGLVLPLALSTAWGPAWVEVGATPTLRLSGARTRAGLRNDFTQVQISVPLSLRLGVLF